MHDRLLPALGYVEHLLPIAVALGTAAVGALKLRRTDRHLRATRGRQKRTEERLAQIETELAKCEAARLILMEQNLKLLELLHGPSPTGPSNDPGGGS